MRVPWLLKMASRFAIAASKADISSVFFTLAVGSPRASFDRLILSSLPSRSNHLFVSIALAEEAAVRRLSS